MTVGACAVLAACSESPVSTASPRPSASGAGLFLDFESASVAAGEMATLRARRVDERGHVAETTVAWRSADESIAVVDGAGRVVGRGIGSTNVWARLGTDSVSALVTVTPGARVVASPVGLDQDAPALRSPSVAAATVAAARWIAITSGPTRLAVTRSVRFAVRTWDSSAVEITPAPKLRWISSQPSVVSVDSTGLATAKSEGSARIYVYQAEVKDGPAASVAVAAFVDPTIPTTATVDVSPAAITLYPDASIQLAAAARTSAGVTLSGRSFTWSSSNPNVATVTPGGLVRALAVGAATITVACDGKTATAAVVVEPEPPPPPAASPPPAPAPAPAPSPASTVARIVVSPDSLDITPGVSVNVIATALTSAGIPVAGRPIVWSSTAPDVATVSDSGVVTAVAAGAAQVVASGDGVADTVWVAVSAPGTTPSGPATPTPTIPGPTTPTPTVPEGPAPGAKVVDVVVTRFDGKSGAVTVSNGVPFPPGWVTEATLPQLHVFVDGKEQRIFTRALAGRHKDGSLRAALVQFEYDVPAGAAIKGQLSVGGERTIGTFAARPASAVPAAVVLPTSPEFLVSTRMGGPLTPANKPAATPLIAQYQADFARLAAEDWARCGAAWACGRTAGYNRGYILYQQWLRTGEPKYWHHATAYADNYLNEYIIPNIGPAPWWSLSEDVTLHYWATGDDRSRVLLRKIADVMAAMARPGISGYALGIAHGDDRLKARVLSAEIDAALLEVSGTPFTALAAAHAAATGGVPLTIKPDVTGALTSATLERALTDLLSSQQPDGRWGGAYYQGGQSAFMVGMLMTSMIRYYDEIAPDPRIPPAIRKTLEYMWANEWDAKAGGFKYVTHEVRDNAGTLTQAPTPQPGLNGLILPAYAWWAAHATDAVERETYRSRVDQILAGGAVHAHRSWWSASGKAFDQAFYRIFNAFAWRD